MKTLALVSMAAAVAGCTAPAQVVIPTPPPTAAPVSAAYLAPEQLDTLLAPIALYPDPLLGLILPASTSAYDLVLAARYLQAGGDPSAVDFQPWEDSVRGLAHYPQVIRWMDENLAWTKQLGDAFSAQPSEVMNAIQRLRARARTAGTLQTTPQQVVVYEASSIAILPAQPNVIYVPYYDPAVVYVPQRTYYSYSPDLFFTFGPACETGWWMSYGLDWPGRTVWVVNRNDRERYWREHHEDWHRPGGWSHAGGPPPPIHAWQPRPDNHPPRHFDPDRPPHIVRPVPPRDRVPRDDRRDEDNWRHDDRPATAARQGPLPPNFVGPTAPPATFRPPPVVPAVSMPTQSAPAPTVPTPGRQWDRGRDDRQDRADRPNRPVTPNYPPQAVAPTMPPQFQHPRSYAPAPAPTPTPVPSAAFQRAPEPRPAPPLQRYSPPPQHAAPPPPPPPPAQGPAQPQSSSNSQSQDDDGRRPTIIRPR